MGLTVLETVIVNYVTRYYKVRPEGVTWPMIIHEVRGYFPDAVTGDIDRAIQSLVSRHIIERTYHDTYEIPPEDRP